ncbi:MAG: hypothetical protein H6730_06700 [Deltaproteobacteria bacterium]|nr:hypothetical protein [Deltaproteobacteria bacterium]
MPFQLTHTLVSKSLKLQRRQEGDQVRVVVRDEGTFDVLFAGALTRRASAHFYHRIRVDPVGPEPVGGEPPRPGTTPRHGGYETVRHTVPLTLELFTPDGKPFTADTVTVADLQKHRDLRGSPSGPWSYRIRGEAAPVWVDEDSTVTGMSGHFAVTILEPIPSESAPPLVDAEAHPGPNEFPFDLFRLGTFVAEVPKTSGLPGVRWQGRLQLVDPNGAVVADTDRSTLRFQVDQRTLSRSRDAEGKVRKWALRVVAPPLILGKTHVFATVIGEARIESAAIQTRVDTLLGPRGKNFEIFGARDGDDAVIRLKINDVVAAETLDMHGLLEDTLVNAGQAAEADPHDIEAGVTYTVYRTSASPGYGTTLDLASLKVEAIDVHFGTGRRLAVPALSFGVSISGAAKISFKGAPLATGRVRGGRLEVELGFKVASGGMPQLAVWVPDSPFDVDISAVVKAALLAAFGVGGLLGGLSVEAFVQHAIDDVIAGLVRRAFANPAVAARMLMTLFGAHLTYRRIHLQGTDLVFEHIAPLEHEPKPTPGYMAAVGRAFGPDPVRPGMSFRPPILGDTWGAANLTRNIDHVVVVMMENRSYDHVLGYRARSTTPDGADGLTQDVVDAVQAVGAPGTYVVRPYREAGFALNAADKRTRLPKPVGHELEDVTEQLSLRTTTAGGRTINSPVGFVENFKPKIGQDTQGVVPNDVLGYYEGPDLGFFEYLAENYAYCDRYYCSHPGPTLPNRMYSLTGDVQHDRYGFPILDNNNGDNFLLSRATTIYDLMTRRGLTWRVYESTPSVTMLRMFARYATDDTNIVPLERLAADVARGDLPAFTAIEPQMHAHPQDDDHPDADMHRGQIFLQGVYQTLRSNPDLWRRTLLLITYDEHGGLYDHVVPPLADVIAPKRTGAISVAGRRAARGRSLGGLGLELEDPMVEAPLSTNPGETTDEAARYVQIPYGVRVPTFVVSPWVAPGKGPGVVLDHCSILKTVLARFWGGDKPFLSDRVHAAHSFEAFLTEAAPRMDVPAPKPLDELPLDVRREVVSEHSRIETPPLSRAQMRRGPVDYHALSGRWARQLGR